MRKDYHVVPKRLIRNQLPPSMVNSSDTDIKEKASLKESRNNVTSSSEKTTKKPVDSNPELENIMVISIP